MSLCHWWPENDPRRVILSMTAGKILQEQPMISMVVTKNNQLVIESGSNNIEKNEEYE